MFSAVQTGGMKQMWALCCGGVRQAEERALTVPNGALQREQRGGCNRESRSEEATSTLRVQG